MIDVALPPLWQVSDYFADLSEITNPLADECIARAYAATCRLTLAHSGFYLINLGPGFGSRNLRQFMVDLKHCFSRLHESRTGKHLVYRSMGRFDQQVTTRPHRDNGPDESLLMLGYEPTSVRANLEMADYTRCAHERGQSPVEFLEDHNPMFASEPLPELTKYSTPISGCDHECFQVLLINNSQCAVTPDADQLLGVLHTAYIVNPTSSEERVVNSTMLVTSEDADEETMSDADITHFLTDDAVKKRY